eukprot:gene9564-6719_t
MLRDLVAVGRPSRLAGARRQQLLLLLLLTLSLSLSLSSSPAQRCRAEDGMRGQEWQDYHMASGTAGTAGVDSSDTPCGSVLYRTACLAHSEHCSWCCDAPAGQQCFNRTEAAMEDLPTTALHRRATRRCAPHAIVNSFPQTCASLCDAVEGNCTACELRPWCIFCADAEQDSSAAVEGAGAETGLCQGPRKVCPSGRLTQKCALLHQTVPPRWLHLLERVLSLSGLVLFAVVSLVLLWCGLRRGIKFLARTMPPLYERAMAAWDRWAHLDDQETDALLGPDAAEDGGVQEPMEGPQSPAPAPAAAADASPTEAPPPAVVEPEIPASAHDAMGMGVEVEVGPMAGLFELCCLCLEAPAAVTYLPCHHTCCCEDCSNRLRPQPRPHRVVVCPLCRQPIEAMVSLRRVFPMASALRMTLDEASKEEDVTRKIYSVGAGLSLLQPWSRVAVRMCRRFIATPSLLHVIQFCFVFVSILRLRPAVFIKGNIFPFPNRTAKPTRMALFGSSSGQSLFPPREPGSTDGELRPQLNERGAPRDSAILTKTELDIIKALIAGAFANSEQRKGRTQSESGEERKRRMLEYDEHCRKSGASKKTAEEVESEQVRQLNLERARTKMDEEYDEVRAMNHILGEAKCVAIRETQRREHEVMRENEADYNRRMDELMAKEAERAQQVYLERERVRVETQRRNAETIKEQLRQNDLERVKKLERHQQEQEAMTRHIERLHQEMQAEKLRRQERARLLMEDAAIANAEQVALKEKQRELLMEEDRKLAEYVRQKEEREQALAEEQQRLRDEKEQEIARLRENQEQAADKRAEIDELRARRLQDQYLREQRRKEEEGKQREAALQEDLRRCRMEQMEERRRRTEQQRLLDQEEVERNMAVQRVALERENQSKARARQLQEENSLALLKQIMEVEERRRRERQEEVEEGHQLAKDARERRAAVEAIRQRKLAELDKLEVPNQYRSAMLKVAK